MRLNIQKIYAIYFMYTLFVQAASFLMVFLIAREFINQNNIRSRIPGIDLKEFK